MSYIQKTFSNDEELIELFDIHWLFYFKQILFFWLIIPLWNLVKLNFIENGLTNKRVIYKKGVISRNTEEMRLNKIETVEVKQSILGRILGYGDVKVTGMGNSFVILSRISNPLRVKTTIENNL
jgi:uncharacterized membrane protein YdbT with pleckstrin-like domain|tara:strand:- start:109 stop:480 length:372 start_codon:yes stop_codon:yes gene_type:complete